jgi:hypothetical protein
MVIRGQQSLSWPTTQGTIRFSQVGTRTIRHRVTAPYERYYPDLLYAYTVAGQRHASTQIWTTPAVVLFGFAVGSHPESTARAAVEAILARYPAGQQVTVWYNPGDPALAALEPGIPPGTEQYFAWAAGAGSGALLTLLLTAPEILTRILRLIAGDIT